jgi:isopentenyl phosphate kinase
LLVVKLGGSIVTRRDGRCRYDSETVRRLGAVLAAAEQPLALVHGLGSLGRAYLPLYDGRILRDRGIGYALQLEFLKLHHLVLTDLEDAGLAVAALDAQTVFAHRAGSVLSSSLDPVHRRIAERRVPVLHGGTFRDVEGRFSVLSSDEIAEQLTRGLNGQLIWVTDVDGVMRSQDEVMPVLTAGNQREMMRIDYDGADLTGGMSNKVRISLRLAEAGHTSHVVNGRRPERLRQLLQGADAVATVIPARDTAGPGAG